VRPGGGYSGATETLDQVVAGFAEWLRQQFGQDVQIRFNSSQMSGGAFVQTRKDQDGYQQDAGVAISASHPYRKRQVEFSSGRQYDVDDWDRGTIRYHVHLGERYETVESAEAALQLVRESGVQPRQNPDPPVEREWAVLVIADEPSDWPRVCEIQEDGHLTLWANSLWGQSIKPQPGVEVRPPRNKRERAEVQRMIDLKGRYRNRPAPRGF
jgi:hypothetical protein